MPRDLGLFTNKVRSVREPLSLGKLSGRPECHYLKLPMLEKGKLYHVLRRLWRTFGIGVFLCQKNFAKLGAAFWNRGIVT